MTRKRLYIESMEAVLSESNKVLVDAKTGSNFYLPIDKLTQTPAVSASSSSSTNSGSTASVDQPQSQQQSVVIPEPTVERNATRSRDGRGR